MAAIPRKTQPIFGGSLGSTPSGNLSEWGSLATGGTALYSGDIADLMGTAAFLQGFNQSLIGNRSPTQADLAGLFYSITQQLACILQSGIPEWDPTGDTEYFQNQIARVGAVIYQVIVSGPVGATSPATDTNNWATLASTLSGPNMIRAFAVFDGTNTVGTDCTLLSSFGVDRVHKLATGKYRVDITSGVMTDGNYGFDGSAGTQNGQNPIAGDNNVICGGIFGGAVAVRTATQCVIYNWDSDVSGSGTLEDSGMISVEFFR